MVIIRNSNIHAAIKSFLFSPNTKFLFLADFKILENDSFLFSVLHFLVNHIFFILVYDCS